MFLSQFNYRVKPQSGDTTIIERVTSNVLTNTGTGTVSVVDRGSGDMAIRVSGGTMLLALPTSLGLVNPGSGSGDIGVTIVMRAKISTLDGANGSTQAIVQAGSTAANDTGVGLLRYGGAGQGLARGNWGTQGTAADTVLAATTERIMVLRMLPNNAADSGWDTFDCWVTGGSGSGNSPDFPTPGGSKTGLTLSHIVSNPLGSNVFDISDFLIYRPTSGANLTDAQCRSFVALGIDAAIAAETAGPTITTQPTAQTASEGATAPFSAAATGTGALTFQWKRQPPGGGAFANVGTPGTSYTTPALDCATDHGANFKCTVSDSNGSTDTATVALTVLAVTTTVRPAADVTTAGWVASAGANFSALIDETTADDADYITSPTVSSTPAPIKFTLKYPWAAGTRRVRFRAIGNAGTPTMRVKLLDATGAQVGVTADQVVTASWAAYDLAVVLSATATHGTIEFVS